MAFYVKSKQNKRRAARFKAALMAYLAFEHEQANANDKDDDITDLLVDAYH